MFESLTRPLMRRAYYLPSDRTGVMHSHQVVVSALIQSATAAGLRPSEWSAADRVSSLTSWMG